MKPLDDKVLAAVLVITIPILRGAFVARIRPPLTKTPVGVRIEDNGRYYVVLERGGLGMPGAGRLENLD
jgi:hypothetical protein